MGHSFHIPVLGLAYSIDTPIKVAKYGISSVISIVDDQLIERIRHYYAETFQKPFKGITTKSIDYRANRITAYLNLVQEIVHEQMLTLKLLPFEAANELTKYFELLPESSPLKQQYFTMQLITDGEIKKQLQHSLKDHMLAGDIDVNIMSKVDKINFDAQGSSLADKFSDALSAIRGFAQSNLQSSVILSAGMNPRLYGYLAELAAFHPTAEAKFNKKIALKVSDFRSALIQAKYLAKKGIWVSEFRIESGLNCGGHAFATDGFLLGPILEEFKNKKDSLASELFPTYQQALQDKGIALQLIPEIKYTVQGGIGTALEQDFLTNYYGFDRTGWGSPFLLVPEATTVDDNTLKALTEATADDFYISDSSPLGVPFNNFRKSTAEAQRIERIAKGRPGSPCTKKYLVGNKEFTDEPICTASREYQHKKILALKAEDLPADSYAKRYQEITAKTCLCDGLASAAYLKYNMAKPKENLAVSICPGPNTAYFKQSYSLREMVDHIYGRVNLLEQVERPFFFINELNLYIEHINKYVENNVQIVNDKKEKYLEKFKIQLSDGIRYYQSMKDELSRFPTALKVNIALQLKEAEKAVENISFQQAKLARIKIF